MIIYADMVGDLFHVGHINFLQQIKETFGSECQIYLGLMGDDEAEKYKRRPILSLTERATMARNCRLVDKVFLNPPMPVTETFLDENNIDLVIHGSDISPESRHYWYAVPMERDIYREIPYTSGISTTEIIRRIALYIAKSNGQ